jgi:hypothetical protein
VVPPWEEVHPNEENYNSVQTAIDNSQKKKASTSSVMERLENGIQNGKMAKEWGSSVAHTLSQAIINGQSSSGSDCSSSLWTDNRGTKNKWAQKQLNLGVLDDYLNEMLEYTEAAAGEIPNSDTNVQDSSNGNSSSGERNKNFMPSNSIGTSPIRFRQQILSQMDELAGLSRELVF